jgi:GrpB-like predicted nucleotidyltransferase (UPF0157 family)
VRFAALAGPLRAALGAVARRIDHVGSTAVPGLAAKPVVDIQVSVESLEPMSPYLLALESLGYVWRPDNPDRTRRFFREPPGQPRTHLHVQRAGSFGEQAALLFRDYLRAHPPAGERYVALKRELAMQYRNDRVTYTGSKAPLIWELLREAAEWSQATGWRPGPSDA